MHNKKYPNSMTWVYTLIIIGLIWVWALWRIPVIGMMPFVMARVFFFAITGR